MPLENRKNVQNSEQNYCHCGGELIKTKLRTRYYLSLLCLFVLAPIVFYISYGTLMSYMSFFVFLALAIYFFLQRNKTVVFCQRCMKKHVIG